MTTVCFVRLGLFGLLSASFSILMAQTRKDEGPVDPVQALRQVRAGMTPKEVRNLVGRPARIARQILYRRYLEQWSYDNPRLVWIEFNCVKGQEPYVLAVHRPREGKGEP
jgi:hypothetical protein